MIRIGVTSVFVDDQDKAEKFYTEVLGFQVKHKVPLGEYSWLTVVSPADPDGIELLLEPDQHPAAKAYKTALSADGIPMMIFTVDDIDAEYRRLIDLGVFFTQPPQPMGQVTSAVFDDTCGNLISLNSPVGE